MKSDPVVDHLRISQMEVDVDKDWLGMGIERVKELAASMDEGDILASTAALITKVSPGEPATVLKTNARSGLPEFAPPV